MRRGNYIFGFIALCLLVAAPAQADTLEPGAALDLLAGGAVSPCETATDVMPVDTTGVSADAVCDETAGTLAAMAVLEQLMEIEASAGASAMLAYEFDISSTTETMDNPVQGYLGYDLSWLGSKQAPADGQAMVDVMLKVWDVTDAGFPVVVVEEEIHSDGIGRELCTEPDCLENPITDAGDDMDMLTMTLLRGHAYRVMVNLEAGANVLATTEAADTISDYMTAIGDDAAGVMVHTLAVAADMDIAELAAQVKENTENIADLQDAVMAREEAVGDVEDASGASDDQPAGGQAAIQALTDRLDDLEGDFEGHTHTYLTGRGVGHNNTEAETGPEIDGDDDEVPTPYNEPWTKNGRAKGRKK